MNFLSQLNFFQNWHQSSQILPQLYQLIYAILNTLLSFQQSSQFLHQDYYIDLISKNHFLCSTIESNYLFIKVLLGDSRHLVTSSGFTSSSLAISTTSAVTPLITDHHNKYSNNWEKIETFQELPKCDTETWTNAVGKMALEGLLDRVATNFHFVLKKKKKKYFQRTIKLQ